MCASHPDRALLFISHGVGEYMGRYDKLGKYLAEKEVLVYGHDHGRCLIVLLLITCALYFQY